MADKPPFVLVHGAFHGGWCWKLAARQLRAAGHEVFTPTQTGLGERRHLLSADITMETFVLDIMNLILSEDLHDVVLVGHSFGGRTIAGVADQIPRRIRRLVFLDAGLSPDGKSRLDGMDEDARSARIQSAMDHDGGISIPAPPANQFDITDPEQSIWVERFLTPQPLGPEKTPLSLANELGNGLPATFVRCIAPVFAVTEKSAAYARSRKDWSYREFASNHEAMISHPNELAALFVDEALRSP